MKTSDAIKWAGGTQRGLAKRIGLAQPSIALWGEYPPPLRQLQIQLLTGGQLIAEPDCYIQRRQEHAEHGGE
jgi:hypothetical protein